MLNHLHRFWKSCALPLMGLLLLFVTACEDFAVYVPGTASRIKLVVVNPPFDTEGRLNLALKNNRTTLSQDVYLLKVTELPEALQSGNMKLTAPILQKTTSAKLPKEFFKNISIAGYVAAGTPFTYDGELDGKSYYVFFITPDKGWANFLIMKSAMTDVGPIQSIVQDNKLVLSWDRVDGAQSYDVTGDGKTISVAGSTLTLDPFDDSKDYDLCIQGRAGKILSPTCTHFIKKATAKRLQADFVLSAPSPAVYKAGDTFTISVHFSENVTVQGRPTLILSGDTHNMVANYKVGSGTQDIEFSYKVAMGDNSSRLDASSFVSFSGDGSINDSQGRPVALSLPVTGSAHSLAETSNILIDTKSPTSPINVHFASSVSAGPQFDLFWTMSTDLNFQDHLVKLCSASDCNTSCGTSLTTADDHINLTATLGSTLYACVRGRDLAGNLSSWTPSDTSISVVAASATVVDVTSPTANGFYKAGDGIDINVLFSEAVLVSNGSNISLALASGATPGYASYTSGSGTNSLTFHYIVRPADNTSDLDFTDASALTVVSNGLISCVAGGPLSLALPSGVHTLAAHKTIVLDTTNPTAPSNVNFTSPLSMSGSVPLNFTPSSDLFLSGHQAKLCSSNDCSSSCSGPSPAVGSSVSLNGLEGTYYGCVQGLDSAGNLSSWTASTSPVVIDLTAPTISDVNSSTTNGSYKAGQVISLQVTFSENVVVTNLSQLSLKLETGATDNSAVYSSGSGTNVLTFQYTVTAGDTATDLDAFATNALTLGASGTIKDSAGNNASLTLPALGGVNSIAGHKNISLDTTNPTAPSGVNFSSATSNTVAVNLNYTAGSDTNFSTTNAKLCSSNDCSTSCLGVVTSLSTPAALSGVSGNSYYGCVQSSDQAGNLSAWLASAGAVSIDSSNPTITSVTSALANGSYKVAQLVPITVIFSKVVNVTGNPVLLLETGATDHSATYTSGSGTTALIFNYTVQAADTTADLEYNTINALSLAGGTIQDSALHNADLTLPSPGGGGSLGFNKALIIDTTAPGLASSLGFASPYSSTTAVSLSFAIAPDTNLSTHNVTLCTVNDCSTGCTGATTSATSPVSLTGTSGATYYGCVQGIDTAGNLGSWAASLATISIDTTAPTVTGVTTTLVDGAYKQSQLVPVSVDFSENVFVTGTPTLLLEMGTTDHNAVYVSGSGSTHLLFNYTVVAGDTNSNLDYQSTSALALAGGTIRDVSGNDATLTLAAPGAVSSLGNGRAIIIDAIAPTDPSLVAFASPSSSSANVSMTWTPSTDGHFKTHNLKLCTANDCSTGCTSASTSTASPGSIIGTNGITYFGCVQGEDLSGNLSSWIASTGTVTIDTSAPTVSNISSSTANGVYKAGQTIALHITFSEAVIVTNGSDLALTLETGTTDHNASYVSGSGTSDLLFNYTIQAGDVSGDLDYVSTTALAVGATGAIKDSAGNNATLTLPVPGAANSIGAQKSIVLDTTAPTSPTSVGFAGASSNTLNFSMSWSNGTDINFRYHNVKICAANDCTTGCTSAATSVSSPSTMTGVNGSTYYGCVQSEDLAGNLSAWVPSASSILVDTTAPTVTNVSSPAANGYYKAGQSLNIAVQFSENVFVTNSASLGLTLETGATDRTATYASGAGSSTLTFTYVVQAGDTNADLDYASTAALTLGGAATIQDSSGNNATLTLPALGGASSIAGQKAIVIDTSAPAAASTVSFGATSTASTSLTMTWANSTDTNFRTHNVKICSANDCSTGCVSAASSVSTPATLTGSDGASYYGCVQGEDLAGNLSAWTASAASISIDATPPTITNISSSTANGAYKAGQTIAVQIQFSEVVNVTNGGNLGLTLETGATDRVATYSSGTGSNTLNFSYAVQAGDVSADLEAASTTALAVGASGTIRDAVGNNATLTLPTLGGASSLSGQKALVIDTVAPVAPNAIIFSTASSTSASFGMSWANGTDTNFRYHNIKICTMNDCATGCTSASTSVSTPATMIGTNGSTYYGCVQSEDLAGNLSAWISSASTVYVDTSIPSVINVSSATANGAYKTGQAVGVSVQFSEIVNVTNSGNLGLTLETGTTDRVATYTSGSGTDTLVFSYTVQAGDTTSDLEYASSTALSVGASGTIRDVSSNDAILTLPSFGSSSLGGQKAIVIDTTAPAAPTSVGFSGSITSSTTFSMSWGNSTDTNFRYHNAKICTANDCSTSCTSALTSASTPATMIGVSGSTYYGCVQGEDLAGNISAWIPSVTTMTIDTTAPTVSNVSSSTANGAYKAGQSILVNVLFNETVNVTNGSNLGLTLETGATDRVATYTSGSGSNTLVFTYTVQAGDTSADLDVQSTAALTLGASGTIKDNAGNNATLTLPALGGASSIAGQKAIVIDTTSPSDPTTVAFASSSSNSTTFSMTWANSTDTNFRYHDAKLCTANDCTTGCTAVTTSPASPLTMTGVNGVTYYGCVQGEDLAGNLSLWVPSSSPIQVDTTAPTLVSVTSSTGNAPWKAGTVVGLTLTFSENVVVTNGSDLTFTLETGAVDRAAVYASNSGNQIVFNYTIQAGDTSEDLDAVSTTALSLGATGAIKDTAGNNAVLTVPIGATSGSLASNKNIIVDTTLPAAPASVGFSGSTSASLGFNMSWTNSTDTHFNTHNAKLCAANDCSTGCTSAITSASSPGAMTGVNGTTYYGCVQGLDLAGNTSAWVPSISPITVDTSAPTVTNVSSSTANGAYKLGQTITIPVQFSETVVITNGASLGLTLETGATDRVASYTSGSGSNTLVFTYTVQAGDTSGDLDIQSTTALSLGGTGIITDNAGNNATLTLPALGGASSIAGQKAIVIDTTTPAAPLTVAFGGTTSTSATLSMSWTNSTDTNFRYHNVKICTANDCATGCTSIATSVATPASMTGANGSTYFGCVQGEDLAANTTAWIPSASTIAVDTTPPTVQNVSSTLANGVYKAAQVVPITVQFSETVSVTNGSSLGLTLETGATDRVAVYASGTGSNTLVFNYTVQAGDTSSDLDVQATTALSLGGTGGTIKDAAGNDATLTLPALGGASSIAGQKAIVIDTTAPVAPSALVLPGVSSTTTTFSLSWTNATDTNFRYHNAKLCTANDCSTGCQTSLTSTASPATMTGVNGSTYYACVQGEDLAANLSTWVASGSTITIDTTVPTVANVSSSAADGVYKVGAVIPLTITFSEAVTVTGTPTLLVETGTTDRTVNYTSGSGSTVLTFNYTVQTGDTSADLDSQSTSALALNAGTIKDSAGNNATLTLPALGGASSIAGQKAIVIDTTTPSTPTSVGFAGASSTAPTFSMSWINSTDTNFRYHDVKMCTANDCSTACVSAATSVSTPATMTGVNGTTYYGCVQGEDLAGNLTAWVPSVSPITVDTSAPTVGSVSSSLADGTYPLGQVVPVTVTFSETVVVTGTPTLLLETGATDRTVNYSSGTGTSVLTFTYTVQAGDTNADLEYQSTAALALAGGTIKDNAGNNAVLTLPALGGAGSLSNAKAIVIDTTNPTLPTTVAFASNYSTSTSVSLSWTASTDTNFSTHNAKLCTASDCSTGCTGAATSVASPKSLTGVAGTTYYGCVQGLDAAGNTSAFVPSAGTVTIDTTAPTVSSVTSSLADGAYKLGQVVPVTVTFSENVTVTGTPTLMLETGTVDRTVNYSSGTGTSILTFNYTVQAGDTNQDLEYQSTAALALNGGTIKDAAGNNATLTLPALGGVGSLSNAKALVIDTTIPTAPSAVTVPAAYSTSTSFSLSWTNATDTNFRYHDAKLCTANDCSTGCLSTLTSVSTPATMTGVNGSAYYACVQGEDLAGNLSAWVASASTIAIDTTVPTVTNVSSSAADGAYKVGAVIPLTITFSEAVTVTGTPTLLVETGTTDRTVNYTSGSGGTVLAFNYTVQTGDTSADLDSQSTTALALNAGTIKDAAGNNATLTLPALGGASSIAGQKAIVIDTTTPSTPTSVGFAAATSTATTFSMSWANSTDTNFRYHDVKICTANDCSTACVSVATSVLTPATMTGVNGTTYYGCVQGEDTAGNLTAWVPSVSTITVDTTAPTVSSVSSSLADGTYPVGQVVPVTVTFSETVVVTGTPTLLLETGATDRNSTYSSGSGSSVLTFNYTVQTGDTNADLEYQSTAALALAGGTIKDNAGNNATLTLPALAGAGSLSNAKAIVIDTTNPTLPTTVAFGSSYSTSTSVSLSWTASIDTNFSTHNLQLCTALNCSTGCTGAATSVASPKSLTGVNGTTYYGCVQGLDAAGNTSAYVPSAGTVTIDTTAPTVSSVTSSLADGAYKLGQVVPVTVTFSENVTVTGTPTLMLETGTVDRTVNYSSGTGTSILTFNYTVQAGDTNQDLEYQSTAALALNAGTIKDAAGNNATLTLPALGGVGSLSNAKALVIDTTTPTSPSSVGFSSPSQFSTSISVAWGVSTDTNFLNHTVMLCTANDCTTGCIGSTTSVASPVSITGAVNTTYYGCVKGNDSAGNSTAFVPSIGTVIVDQTAPTITDVTSSTTNGYYAVGATIDVSVTFSETVVVTNSGNLGLLLETGATDRTAVYLSGSGSTALVFRYTVQAGDTTTDLDSQSTAALTLGGAGTIKDGAGNNATLTLPALGGIHSIAGQKAIVVDTTNPTNPATPTFAKTSSLTNAPTITWTNGTDTNFSTHNVKLCTSNGCSTGCGSVSTSTSSPAAATGTYATTVYACIQSQDLAGNTSSWVASAGTTYLETSPASASISSATYSGMMDANNLQLNVTLAANPDSNITAYRIYFSTSATIGTFNFASPLATITRGDSTYDSSPTDTSLIFPVDPTTVQDGYYVVRFYDSTATYTDTNTTVSSLTTILTGASHYAIVPKKYSGLSYDYYIMRYEAMLTAGLTAGDAVTTTVTNKAICEAKFHTAGTVWDSSCGTNNNAGKYAVSAPSVAPTVSISWDQAFTACRNASNASVNVRLATAPEWSRSAQGYDTTYAAAYNQYISNGSNMCVNGIGSVANTKNQSSCKTALGIYDLGGNVTEWVDYRITPYDISANAESRFGYGPVIGKTLSNGIDNIVQRLQNFPASTTMGMAMGSYVYPSAIIGKPYGTDFENFYPTGNTGPSLGFRCVAFPVASMPTMAQLALPDEPKFTSSDYSGAASTWTIPENKYIGDNKPETVAITVNGNTGDAIAEGNIAINWKPWAKTTCTTAGVCSASDASLVYKLYRFIEPNFFSNRFSVTWALNKTGSTYTADLPLDPIGVDATGTRLYSGASTNGGKLIATISNCVTATPANCTFTDSTTAGTGFLATQLYNYILVVEDASGNATYPTVQRFRSRYYESQYLSGASGFRFEPRLRRAGVFTVDEGYNIALTMSETMVHVPLDKSGLDHDFYIQKYEADYYNGTESNVAADSAWPLQAAAGTGTWIGNAGDCQESFNQNQTFSTTSCGDGTIVHPSTGRLSSFAGASPDTGVDQGSFWKECHNTGIVDANSKVYYFRLPSDTEWFKAADWGDVNHDGTIDQNSFTGGVTSINTLENGPGDTTTVRCHTDSSPASALTTGGSETANCRSRYGAQNMVGNVWEWTASQIYSGVGLDNGLDGLTYGAAYPTANSSIFNLGSHFDLLRGIPKTTSYSSITDNSDSYYYGSGLMGSIHGGSWTEGSAAGRFTYFEAFTPSQYGAQLGGRCSY